MPLHPSPCGPAKLASTLGLGFLVCVGGGGSWLSDVWGILDRSELEMLRLLSKDQKPCLPLEPSTLQVVLNPPGALESLSPQRFSSGLGASQNCSEAEILQVKKPGLREMWLRSGQARICTQVRVTPKPRLPELQPGGTLEKGNDRADRERGA